MGSTLKAALLWFVNCEREILGFLHGRVWEFKSRQLVARGRVATRATLLRKLQGWSNQEGHHLISTLQMQTASKTCPRFPDMPLLGSKPRGPPEKEPSHIHELPLLLFNPFT